MLLVPPSLHHLHTDRAQGRGPFNSGLSGRIRERMGEMGRPRRHPGLSPLAGTGDIIKREEQIWKRNEMTSVWDLQTLRYQ